MLICDGRIFPWENAENIPWSEQSMPFTLANQNLDKMQLSHFSFSTGWPFQQMNTDDADRSKTV